MLSAELHNCLFCGGENLIQYLDLGNQPPANSYSDKPFEEIEKYPLKVNLCTDCGHSQLSVAVYPEVLFSNYLYVSGTTKTLENHFIEFAKECTEKYGSSEVLEIGCNDGSCLKQFKKQGWDTLGIDPAENLLPYSRDNGVNVLPLFWKYGVSKRLGDKKFKVIYGTNVFAHNLSPYDFLSECLNVLAQDGVIIVEAPYSFNMFNIIDVGQIYHEHINYLSVSAMIKLCDRLNIGIVDIIESDVHGGSIRFYMQSNKPNCVKSNSMSMDEIYSGIKDIEFYKKFSTGVMRNILDLSNCINEQRDKYKVVGYGAAAKASTIINALVYPMNVDYIVDDNPLKVGKYMPGTGIQILPTSTIKQEQSNLAFWIPAHNFQKEIIERIKEKRNGKKDIVINYVPDIKTEQI